MSDDVELPRWRSHKVVAADEIVTVAAVTRTPDGGGHREEWVLKCGAKIQAMGSLRSRVPAGTNACGGYYVRYEDGFESWSPARAFEDGYTRI